MNDLLKNVCELLGFSKDNTTVKKLSDGSVVVTLKSDKAPAKSNPDGMMRLLHEIFDDGVQLEADHEDDKKVKLAQRQTAQTCIAKRHEFQHWLDNFDNAFITALFKSFQGSELYELNEAIMENTTDSVKLDKAVVQVKHRAKELARKKLAFLESQMKQYASYLDKD